MAWPAGRLPKANNQRLACFSCTDAQDHSYLVGQNTGLIGSDDNRWVEERGPFYRILMRAVCTYQETSLTTKAVRFGPNMVTNESEVRFEGGL